MFENPRRGRQARNFTTNVPKILDLKSSSEQISEQIFSENCRWVPLIQGPLCASGWTETAIVLSLLGDLSIATLIGFTVFEPRGYSLIKAIQVCATPKGRFFLRRFVWKRLWALPIVVWNRVRYSKEVRESMNVFYRFKSNWEGKIKMRIRNGF